MSLSRKKTIILFFMIFFLQLNNVYGNTGKNEKKNITKQKEIQGMKYAIEIFTVNYHWNRP